VAGVEGTNLHGREKPRESNMLKERELIVGGEAIREKGGAGRARKKGGEERMRDRGDGPGKRGQQGMFLEDRLVGLEKLKRKEGGL